MVYFTSDNHFYHQNVIRYCNRPYEDVESMNEDMISKWNSLVTPEDTVYVLGDFSLAFRPVEAFSFRFQGTRYLVPGNHDFNHSYHKKSRNNENREKWHQKYRDYGWNVLPEQITIDLPGLGLVNMCHHPYATEFELKEGDKYKDWRPVDDGKLLLCGHVHEKWLTKKSPNGTLMINVGVDQHGFAPVSLDKIIEIAKANGVG